MQHSPPATRADRDTPSVEQNPINAKQDEQSKENVGERFGKRRRREDSEVYMDMLQDFMDKMNNWTTTQNSQNLELLQAINDLKQQNAELQKSVSFVSTGYDDIKLQLNQMMDERKSFINQIQSLEQKVESLERHSRSSSFEISNIPKKQTETKADLVNVVVNLGNAVNAHIQQSDIRDVYRINTKSETNKPLVVELSSVILKENIINATKKFNKDHKEDKLNTQTLHLDGPKKAVFISESLTFKAKRLFYLARDFAKSNNFTFCWTSFGKVYLRKAEKEKLIKIENESDLKALCNK